jgi:hypothetical protein
VSFFTCIYIGNCPANLQLVKLLTMLSLHDTLVMSGVSVCCIECCMTYKESMVCDLFYVLCWENVYRACSQCDLLDDIDNIHSRFFLPKIACVPI